MMECCSAMVNPVFMFRLNRGSCSKDIAILPSTSHNSPEKLLLVLGGIKRSPPAMARQHGMKGWCQLTIFGNCWFMDDVLAPREGLDVIRKKVAGINQFGESVGIFVWRYFSCS